MIFANVKGITIPEGVVKRITQGSAVLWQAAYDAIVSGVSPLTLPSAVQEAIVYLKQLGVCEQNGTPTPSVPVDIYCNNGALRMRHRSGLPNGYTLLDSIGSNGSGYVLTDTFLASTDVVESEFRNSSTTGYGALYGVFALGDSSAFYGNGTYYGYNEINGKVDTGITVDTSWHTARHDFVNGELTIDGQTTTFTPFTFTNSRANAVLARYYNNSYGYVWKGYIRKFRVIRNGEVISDLLPCKDTDDNIGLYDLVSGAFHGATSGTLLEGNVVDDYELYVAGTPEVLTIGQQSASVQDLLAVGDYKDEQDIISGNVTHRVGIKVFDGTELYSSMSYGYATEGLSGFANESFAPLCTHFMGKTTTSAATDTIRLYFTSGGVPRTYFFVDKTVDDFSTVDKFTAWLASQYAAGTPVIVVYPLATATTESVTAQPLNTAEGDNVISITAEVSNIPLEVKYKRN